jgi:hypothetical protein
MKQLERYYVSELMIDLHQTFLLFEISSGGVSTAVLITVTPVAYTSRPTNASEMLPLQLGGCVILQVDLRWLVAFL